MYKTYIDVVHVEKTETARLFCVATVGGEDAESSQEPASPSGAGIDISQPDAAPLNTTDASAADREAQEERLQVPPPTFFLLILQLQTINHINYSTFLSD